MEFLLLLKASLKFITANWWRTGCLTVAIIAIALYATIHIQSLRLRQADIAYKELQLVLDRITVESKLKQGKLDVAMIAFEEMKKKQAASAKRIADLMKNWPTECNEAAISAADILRKRGEE